MLLEKEPESLNFLLALLRYLAGGSDKVSATELNEILEKAYPKGEDIMPTILQEAKAEAKAEGIIEGSPKIIMPPNSPSIWGRIRPFR